MKKIYFHPKMDNKTVLSPNPYILDFQDAICKNFVIVNRRYNRRGVLDFFRYIFKTDIYILNWIENLPTLRFGKVQVIVFQFFILLSKIMDKKVIWILHNKYSHSIDKNPWTDLMFSVMMKRSNLILTHAKSGIDFGQKYYPKQAHKIKYIFHPIKQLLPQNLNSKKAYDFLIWGSISPYKGVLEFLHFVSQNKNFSYLKILIVGRCLDDSYKNKLKPYFSNMIILKDNFFKIEDVAEFAIQSRFILFTHKATSVLSSGSLIDSIRMNSRIIGPDVGAFKDLKSLSFIDTYKTYEDILVIHKKYGGEKAAVNPKEHHEFYKRNTWETFGNRMHLEIDKLSDS
jgi:hypothetical protein